jgi:hypothetical protein
LNRRQNGKNIGMSRPVMNVLYVAVMVAVIVAVDFAFFRNHFRERLIANVGIVLLFTAFYLGVLRATFR